MSGPSASLWTILPHILQIPNTLLPITIATEMTFLPPFLEGTQITATTYKWDFPAKERQLLRVSTEPISSATTSWRSSEDRHHHQGPAAASPSSAVTHSRSQSDAVTTPSSATSERPGAGTTAAETPVGPIITGLQRRETEPLHTLVTERKKQSMQ